MIQGISHITLIVEDLQRTTLLFTQLFDAVEVYASGEDTFSFSREKFFTVAGQWFAIMEGKPDSKSEYEHIAFKIADADFVCYEEQIKAMGLTLRTPRPRVEGEGRSLYFYDWDGHLFELHTGTLEERLKRYSRSDGY